MTELKTYEFQREARAALLDELIAAGFPKDIVVGMTEEGNPNPRVWVTAKPEDFAKVASIVQAHDATAVDTREAQRRAARRAIRQTILDFPDIATPTNAQTVTAVKALSRAVRDLYREE